MAQARAQFVKRRPPEDPERIAALRQADARLTAGDPVIIIVHNTAQREWLKREARRIGIAEERIDALQFRIVKNQFEAARAASELGAGGVLDPDMERRGAFLSAQLEEFKAAVDAQLAGNNPVVIIPQRNRDRFVRELLMEDAAQIAEPGERLARTRAIDSLRFMAASDEGELQKLTQLSTDSGSPVFVDPYVTKRNRARRGVTNG